MANETGEQYSWPRFHRATDRSQDLRIAQQTMQRVLSRMPRRNRIESGFVWFFSPHTLCNKHSAPIGIRQTYGRNPVSFHPHIHCLDSDGCFSRDGQFHLIPWVDAEKMMRLFRHKLFQALLAEEIITTRIVDLLRSRQHPGFSVFRSEPVEPDDRAARERLVRYLLHPAFALDRLHYDPDTGTVIYHPAKKGSDQDSRSKPEVGAAP